MARRGLCDHPRRGGKDADHRALRQPPATCSAGPTSGGFTLSQDYDRYAPAVSDREPSMRHVAFGLLSAFSMGILYALWCHEVPRDWHLTGDARDVLTAVGVLFAGVGFLVGFELSRLERYIERHEQAT